jgi:hypothetical protein
LLVDHGRIVKNKIFFAAGRAIVVNQFDFLFQQARGQLLWIGDGGRAADELRLGAVKRADPLQPPQHVVEVAAKNAAIAVQLINHHVLEIFKKLHPLGVMRQDAGMQHVGIADHDVSLGANGLAGVLGGVAIVRKGLDVFASELNQLVKLFHLILGQGLGGKKIKCAGVGIRYYRVQHGNVVTKRLPRSRRRDHHHILAGQGLPDGFCLVAIELSDAALAEGFNN